MTLPSKNCVAEILAQIPCIFLFHYSTIMSFYHIRSREQAKYKAVSWFNRFTTGQIPADAKGATAADRIRMFWIPLLENRNQNNIFALNLW